MDYRKHSTWSLMVSLWTEQTRGLDQRQLIWRILRWWQISSMKANVFKFFLQRGEVYAVMCSMTDNWLSEWRSPDLCLPISVVSIFPPWLMVVFNNWLAKCLKVSLANLSWLHYTHCAVSPLPGLGRFVIALIKSPMQVSLWFQKLVIKPVQLPLWCWNTHSGNTLWEHPLGAPSRHAKSLTTWEQHAGKAICRPSQWNAASGHTHQCAEYMREAVLDTLGRSGYEVTSMNATENKNITQLSPAFLPDFQSCEI